jgi:photosystem II stability/assembly factor-like uncharacterized protein
MFLRCALALAASTGLLFLSACHEVHFEPRDIRGEIVIYDDLFSVSPVGENRVVAGGYWGSIYTSADGGESWARAETNTKHLVYAVSMADDQRGWAVGQVGLVLRTEDGGLTWTPQPNDKVEQGVHLFAVQALDAQRAWAVGEWGTRIYTEDGGKTWQDRSLTVDETHSQFVWLSVEDQARVRRGDPVFEDVGLNDVFCLPVDTERCWMIGEFGYVFYSDSGGRTWERGEILSGIQIDPIGLPHNTIELTEEQEERVAEFARAIADQQHLNVAIEPYVSEREIQELYRQGDPYPIFELVEARTQEVAIAVESAGILSDRVRRRGEPPWDYEDFLEEDPEFLDRYLEGRRKEEPSVAVEIAQNPYLFTIRFADEKQGYVAGLGGVVLRSEDGGRIWRYEEIGMRMALFSVQAFPDGRAIVVGEKGLIRVSGDGGATWQPLAGFPEIFTFMRDIQFNEDNSVGYIVGQRALVLRSTDGGRSWERKLPKAMRTTMDLAGG